MMISLELIAAFTPADKQAEARAKMKFIKQERGETATQYGARFMALANKTGITTPIVLIEAYTDGLHTDIQKKIQGWDAFPTVLIDFMRKVERLDQRTRRVIGLVAALHGNSNHTAS
jgi:hypothetical protein